MNHCEETDSRGLLAGHGGQHPDAKLSQARHGSMQEKNINKTMTNDLRSAAQSSILQPPIKAVTENLDFGVGIWNPTRCNHLVPSEKQLCAVQVPQYDGSTVADSELDSRPVTIFAIQIQILYCPILYDCRPGAPRLSHKHVSQIGLSVHG